MDDNLVYKDISVQPLQDAMTRTPVMSVARRLLPSPWGPIVEKFKVLGRTDFLPVKVYVTAPKGSVTGIPTIRDCRAIPGYKINIGPFVGAFFTDCGPHDGYGFEAIMNYDNFVPEAT